MLEEQVVLGLLQARGEAVVYRHEVGIKDYKVQGWVMK